MYLHLKPEPKKKFSIESHQNCTHRSNIQRRNTFSDSRLNFTMVSTNKLITVLLLLNVLD